jgi:hypothetical protein
MYALFLRVDRRLELLRLDVRLDDRLTLRLDAFRELLRLDPLLLELLRLDLFAPPIVIVFYYTLAKFAFKNHN